MNTILYDERPYSIYRADENIEYDFDLNKIYDLLDQEKYEEILSIFQESDINLLESFNLAYVAGICNFHLYFNKEDPTYLEKAIGLLFFSTTFLGELGDITVEEYLNLIYFVNTSYALLIHEKEINEETFEFYEAGAQLIIENLLGTIKDFREVFEATPDIAEQYFINMATFLSIFNNYLISIDYETDYREKVCIYAKEARQSKNPEIVVLAACILIEYTHTDEEEIIEYCLELIDHEDGFVRTQALLTLAHHYSNNGYFFKTFQTLEQIPKPIDDYHLAWYNYLLGRCHVLTGTQGPETLKLFTKARELTGNDHERSELLVRTKIDSYIFELTDDEDYLEKCLKYHSHKNLYPGLFNYYLADSFFRRKEYQRCSEEIHNSWNADEHEQTFNILLFIDGILGYHDKIEQLRSTITDSSIKIKYIKHLDIIKNILEKKWSAVFELIDLVQNRVSLNDKYFVIGEKLFPMLKYYPTCYFREQDYLKSLKGMVFLANGKTKKAEHIFQEGTQKSEVDPIALCCMREIALSYKNYQQADMYSTMLKIAKENQPSPEFVWYADLRNPPVKSLIHGQHKIKPTDSTMYPKIADQAIPRNIQRISSLKIEPVKNIFINDKEIDWKDITILRVSKDAILIKAKSISKRYTYYDLGLQDSRKGDMPNRLWYLLMYLAKNKGHVPYDKLRLDVRKKIEKGISDLRGILKSVTGLSTDPFQKFSKSHGYVARFAIKDERPTINKDHREKDLL